VASDWDLCDGGRHSIADHACGDIRKFEAQSDATVLELKTID
jgi:hypothetical protein